jgi:hypothetical protein
MAYHIIFFSKMPCKISQQKCLFQRFSIKTTFSMSVFYVLVNKTNCQSAEKAPPPLLHPQCCAKVRCLQFSYIAFFCFSKLTKRNSLHHSSCLTTPRVIPMPSFPTCHKRFYQLSYLIFKNFLFRFYTDFFLSSHRVLATRNYYRKKRKKRYNHIDRILL